MGTTSWNTVSAGCGARVALSDALWSGAADHEGSRLHEGVGLDAESEASQEMEAGARDNMLFVVMRP